MADAITRRAEELGSLRGERAAVEVAYRQLDDSTKTRRGLLIACSGGQLVVEVAGAIRRYDLHRVRYLNGVDEMLNCSTYTEGDEVRFRKYGGEYVGKVTGVFKTRLAVLFKTIGDHKAGRAGREVKIRAIEVERVERTTNY